MARPLNVLLFGATGMVGMGVLLECLDAREVASVLVVGRQSCGVTHAKLKEILLADLFEVDSIRASLAGIDSCFWCLGVTSVGISEEAYRRITHDLTMRVAEALRAASPAATFVFVSGEGADSSERGRSMWARVKGKTENDLLALGFPGAWVFRPGLIQPLRGVRSRTGWYQAFYTTLGPMVSLMRRFAPGVVTTTVDVGRAMIRVAEKGNPEKILRSGDINRVAATA